MLRLMRLTSCWSPVGFMVALETDKGTVTWAMVYDSEMPNTGYNYYAPLKQYTFAPPMIVDGILYFKGMRSPRLVALDPLAPTLAWQRPVSTGAMQ